MSFGSPVRNGLGIGLTPSTALSSGRIGGRPAMFLNFVGATALSSNVTFTRGSNATLVDSTGKITYAPANLLTYSQDFTNALWVATASAKTSTNNLDPAGTSTALLITANGASTAHYLNGGTGISYTSGTTYMASAYVKAGSTSFAQVTLPTSTFGTGQYANFELTGSGSVTASAGGTASIVPAGDGWYRVTFSAAATATASTAGFFLVFIANGTAGRLSVNTSTDTLYFWGAQLEPVTYQTTAGPYVATTTAAYYGPRFDYDPVTLAAKGLLIEEQRTNLLTYSAQFDNAAWPKISATVTANVATAPDGTSTMDAIANNAGAVAAIYQQLTVANSVYTASLYLKAGTASSAAFILRDITSSTNLSITGVIMEGSGTLTATGSSSITVSGLSETEFTRVAVTLSSPAVAGNLLRFTIYPESISSGGSTGKNVLIWGAQLEAGAFATSYIPTVASQVTRSADVATMTGTNFSSWYNQSEGTFVVGLQAVNGRLLSANDGTLTNRILAVNRASAILFGAVITDAAVTQASLTSAVADASAINNVSLAYKADSFAYCSNGGVVSTDNAGTVPTVNQLDIGRDATFAGTGTAHFRQIAYYNTRLPNATLQALTA
jgi:hypothetical protein